MNVKDKQLNDKMNLLLKTIYDVFNNRMSRSDAITFLGQTFSQKECTIANTLITETMNHYMQLLLESKRRDENDTPKFAVKPHSVVQLVIGVKTDDLSDTASLDLRTFLRLSLPIFRKFKTEGDLSTVVNDLLGLLRPLCFEGSKLILTKDERSYRIVLLWQGKDIVQYVFTRAETLAAAPLDSLLITYATPEWYNRAYNFTP